ncbi:MAG: hypothetical protein UHD09_04490 [Bifidobacterium sp.]|nr:hypothetical protein [Bifidobacterium sp.]
MANSRAPTVTPSVPWLGLPSIFEVMRLLEPMNSAGSNAMSIAMVGLPSCAWVSRTHAGSCLTPA